MHYGITHITHGYRRGFPVLDIDDANPDDLRSVSATDLLRGKPCKALEAYVHEAGKDGAPGLVVDGGGDTLDTTSAGKTAVEGQAPSC